MKGTLALFAVLLLLSSTAALGQACRAPALAPLPAGADMFTPAQEMELGHIWHSLLELRVRVIDDPALTAYLYRVGARLEKSLPDSGLKFHYYVIDIPEANAWSQIGGQVYVSRKLIAYLKSEDELAGVMGHEMGHIVTHQSAVETSREFREVLGIKELSPNEDIFERYNDLLDSIAKGRSNSRTGDEYEVAADNVSVYAIAAAGYDVKSLPTFWDRFTENRGKTGSFLTDLFSVTTEDRKRYRDMLKSAASLDPACIAAREPGSESEFKQWQSRVVAYEGIGHPEQLPHLVARKALNPPLRSEITHIRISPDGRYMLAQDAGSILVLSRQELKPLFRIDAEDAGGTEFSLDSREIVFYTGGRELGSSPRIEVWDVESQSQKAVSEAHLSAGCVQSALSRDGHYFACLSENGVERSGFNFDLRIVNVETGAITVERAKFYTLDVNDEIVKAGGIVGVAEVIVRLPPSVRLGALMFSPDSHTLLFGHYSTAVALDAATGDKVPLPSSVRDAMKLDFSFLDGSRMVGAGSSSGKGVVVKYPTGEVLYKDLKIGPLFVSGAAHGDFVVLHGMKDYASVVFDLKQNKWMQGSKRVAMDIYDDTYIREQGDGELGIVGIQDVAPSKTVQLLPGPLAGLTAEAVSEDLNTVALSGTNRGAVWDMEHEARLVHIRSFHGASLPPGYLLADFPEEGETKHTIGFIRLADQAAQAIDVEASNRDRLVGRYLIEMHPENKNEPRKHLTLTVKDLYDNLKVLWTRNFPNGLPALFASRGLNHMVLLFDANSDSGKAAQEASPELRRQYQLLKTRAGVGYLEVVDAATGQVTGRTLIDTGKLSFRINDVLATADRVIVADTNMRVRVFGYDGVRQGRVLGSGAAVSPDGHYLVVYTGRGRLSAYDLATMQPVADFAFSTPAALVAFANTQPRLLVLTREQKAYYFDLAKAAKQP
jgi:hypothetical protein